MRTLRFAAVLCGLFVVLLPARPAEAHAVLQRTSPAANAVVAAPPIEVLLTFSEGVSVVPGKVRVLGPDGARADRGDPVVRGGVVAIPLRTDAPRGTYLVNYRVISADSHPVAGGFTYSFGERSTTAVSGSNEELLDPVVQVAIPAVKYVGYAGLVLLVGPTLVLAALWPRRLSRRGPMRLAWLGLGAVSVATVVGLVLQAPHETGSSLGGISGDDLRDVLGSSFGTIYIVRLAVLAAAVFLLRPMLTGRADIGDRALLTILAVVGVSTFPLTGHPIGSPLPMITVLADAAHLTAMAVWLGGLVMLFGFLLRQASEDELGAILPIWSRWAAIAVTVLLFAGTISALVEVGTVPALVTTTYGRLVLAKVLLFGLVMAVAAGSRRLVVSRVAAGAPGRLRRLVAVELGVAAVVLALAATLVQEPPARSAADAPGVGPYSTTLSALIYSLQVDISPARTGTNSIHLFAYNPAGQPIPVVEWRATAALPAAGVEPLPVPLLGITDNHAIGDIALPTAGDWEFRFTLRLSEVDQATVSTTVHIR